MQAPIRHLLLSLTRILWSAHVPVRLAIVKRWSRFISAFISAYISFILLNFNPSQSTAEQKRLKSAVPLLNAAKHPGPFEDPPERLRPEEEITQYQLFSRAELAGKTMDLSIFAVIRALDIAISTIWARGASTRSKAGQIVSRVTPSILFCFSAATIMHSWFYSPSRLPQTYNRWISAAAALDRRLLLALRHARYGTFVYKKDTGMAPLLGSLAKDLHLPEELGDPAKTVPVPCELVHMGCGKSCEKHAIFQFCRGGLFAAKMYAPLQLLVLARKYRSATKSGAKLSWDAVLRAGIDVTRSSSFLGAFIALFYYGVCLSRTRLGPKLFSSKTVSPQMWDSGLCVLGGSLLCGSSILVERERRRLEILLFVLPRAAATWFPRRYLREDRWKEHLAFTLSTAIVFTTAQEAPQRVRGMLGTVLHGILTST